MYSLKDNGDRIAREFAGLMGGTAKTVAVPVAVLPVKTASHEALPEEDFSSALEDMILDSDTRESDENYASDLIDDDISDMDEYDPGMCVSARQKYILSGLNKISKDLRSKGEIFASDVVSATMLGITSDIKKEASKNNAIVNTLNKIAKDLTKSGDQFAADMVIATRNKIS